LTLIIAASTLIERKFLSLMQRRVGPQFAVIKVDYNILLML